MWTVSLYIAITTIYLYAMLIDVLYIAMYTMALWEQWDTNNSVNGMYFHLVSIFLLLLKCIVMRCNVNSHAASRKALVIFQDDCYIMWVWGWVLITVYKGMLGFPQQRLAIMPINANFFGFWF